MVVAFCLPVSGLINKLMVLIISHPMAPFEFMRYYPCQWGDNKMTGPRSFVVSDIEISALSFGIFAFSLFLIGGVASKNIAKKAESYDLIRYF